ncbi:MAG TPA: RdgB/HAM1 family non-canonical purine NTP pyrophosphatase [Phycisphaerae bacterium]|nr:RdgB/HAM1 family non-canonical purine NTP pyrophosphatase [Phycisphaerae bacterium]
MNPPAQPVDVLIATTNRGKVAEIHALASQRGGAGAPGGLARVRWRRLDEFPAVADSPEHGRTLEQNARQKALHYAAATGLMILADDSGLEVDALDGRPGVDSAYFAGVPRDDAANNRKLVAALRRVPPERRTARFRCALALALGDDVLLECTGHVAGRIVDTPRGENGFGYDPHFLLPELERTMAELSPDEKNRLSHRGRALRIMLDWLDERLRQRAGAP